MVDDDAKDCQYSDSDWCNFSYGPGMHYIWINWLPTSPTLSFSKKKNHLPLNYMCLFLACSPFPQQGALGLTLNSTVLF